MNHEPMEGLSWEIVDLLPCGVMLCRGGQILHANRQLADWLDSTPESLRGLTTAKARLLGLEGLLDSGEELQPGGSHAPLRLRRQRFLAADGTETHILDRVLPSGHQANRGTQAAALGWLDTETALLSREALLLTLEQQVSRSRRYGNPLAIIALTLKPETGEVPPPVLRLLTEGLREELRWVDQIGRFDRHGLLLILPETPMAAAEELAIRLGRDRATCEPLKHCAVETAVTAWQAGDDVRKLLGRVGFSVTPS